MTLLISANHGASTALMVQWLRIKVLEPYRLELLSQGSEDVYERLADRFSGAAKTLARKGDDAPDLSSALAELLESVTRESASLSHEVANDVTIALGQLISTQEDSVDPFSDIYEKVVSATADLYQKQVAAAEAVRRASLEVVVTQEKPHQFDVDYCATAVTTFGFSSEPRADVRLKLCSTRFDWETYLSLTYVLMHELVCHVPQGPWGGERTYPDTLNPFAEGWMDYVAMQQIRRRCASGTHPFTSDHQRVSEDFSASRWARPTATDSLGWSRRAIGVAVAVRVLHLLRRLGLQEPADDVFIQLSLDLNVSSRSHASREALVYHLYRWLPSEDGGSPRGLTPDEYERLGTSGVLNALVAYLRTGDVKELAGSTRGSDAGETPGGQIA